MLRQFLCEKLIVHPEDKVVKVHAESDFEFLRKITFIMASGEEKTFGTWDGKISREALYNFSEKRDILGLHGWVKRNPDNPEDDHIMSLGFTYNACPGRDLLDH